MDVLFSHLAYTAGTSQANRLVRHARIRDVESIKNPVNARPQVLTGRHCRQRRQEQDDAKIRVAWNHLLRGTDGFADGFPDPALTGRLQYRRDGSGTDQ